MDVLERKWAAIAAHGMADADTPVLLMVSGGSDSTALAYAACELAQAGELGMLAMLHVNHHLRGEDADADAAFVSQLADALAIPLFMCDIDVTGEVARTGGNVEAVARSERYLAANEALESLCRHAGAPLSSGRIFTAQTRAIRRDMRMRCAGEPLARGRHQRAHGPFPRLRPPRDRAAREGAQPPTA